MPTKNVDGAVTPALKKEEDVLSTAQQLSPVTDDDLNKRHEAEKDKPLKQPQKGRFGKARSGPSDVP